MDFLKKILKVLILTAGLWAFLTLLGSAVSSPLLNLAFRATVSSIDHKLQAKKSGSVKAKIGKVYMTLAGNVIGKDIEVEIVSRKDTGDIAIVQGIWRIRQAELVVKDLFKGAFFLKVEGLRFQPRSKMSFTKSLLFVNERCLLYSTIAPASFLTEKRKLSFLIRDFRANGTTDLPVTLSGRITFLMKGKEILFRFRLVGKGNRQSLEVDTGDLRQVADLMGEPVTDQEVIVMSGNPLKMIDVLRIKNAARKKAAEACGNTSYAFESRCRHVLFSYKLTQAFGQRFAKRLTDAREIGDKDDAYDERALDDYDSSRGREYALSKTPEKEMLEEILRENSENSPSPKEP